MNNIIIYPFTPKQIPIIKFSNLFLDNIELIPLIPSAINRNSKNLKYLTNTEDLFVNKVFSEDNFPINSKNKYIFCNANGTMEMLNLGLNLTNKLTKNNIEYCNCLSLNNFRMIENNINKYPHLKLMKTEKFTNLKLSSNTKLKLKSINKPVIGIGSIISNNDKSEVCLMISKYYKKKGVKVATIMSDPIYEYIGTYFMEYDKLINLGIDTAIYFINNCISELTYDYDIIIIEIPGQLIKYSSDYLDTSGVIAFMISQAIIMNKFICCIPVNFNQAEYYNKIVDILYKRFNYMNVNFHMSNFLPEFNHRPIAGELPGIYINNTEYYNSLNRVNKLYSNIYNFKNITSFTNLF